MRSPPGSSTAISSSTEHNPVAQARPLQLDAETLSDVIGVIASSPDLDLVLDRVVEVLTKATDCHACFIYLRRGNRLRMRAASRIYAHLVGSVEFGADEGLAGWAMTNNELAFIREDAQADPRTNLVEGLDEDRFQSIIAVPIPRRGGGVMGVIVLHTIAPRTFDQATLRLLSHAAPLVAGAIENAQLYAQAQDRVAALTGLTALSEQIAASSRRDEVYQAASAGVRSLLNAVEARFYELDSESRTLEMVASDPPAEGSSQASVSPAAILLEMLDEGGMRDETSSARLRSALGMSSTSGHIFATRVVAGHEQLGMLVVRTADPLEDDGRELLRGVANHVALAMRTASLIEGLTDHNIVRDLFSALQEGRDHDAELRARQASLAIEDAWVVIEARRARQTTDAHLWIQQSTHAEAALRRVFPGVLCQGDEVCIRAIVPLGGGGTARELTRVDDHLLQLAAREGLAIGRSGVNQGAATGADALREAADSAAVAEALEPGGGLRAFGDLGAYRYLLRMADESGPDDAYVSAARAIAAYDAKRSSQLVATLEQFLADRRNLTATARSLNVHPNTLRQRLERIETLTGLDLAEADLLALELAIKLVRLRT